MALFPLQLAFAAAAAYCAHPSDHPPKHFGHHEHFAFGQADNAGDDDGPMKISDEAECELGHLGCVHFLSIAPWSAAVCDGGIVLAFLSVDASSYDPEPWERPKWRVHA